jgi:hypothetical protein
VLDGDARSECRSAQRRNRRCKRYLRHHQQNLAASSTDVCGQAQVNLGLAASGDTVQQRHLEALGVGKGRERSKGAALFFR